MDNDSYDLDADLDDLDEGEGEHTVVDANLEEIYAQAAAAASGMPQAAGSDEAPTTADPSPVAKAASKATASSAADDALPTAAEPSPLSEGLPTAAQPAPADEAAPTAAMAPPVGAAKAAAGADLEVLGDDDGEGLTADDLPDAFGPPPDEPENTHPDNLDELGPAFPDPEPDPVNDVPGHTRQLGSAEISHHTQTGVGADIPDPARTEAPTNALPVQQPPPDLSGADGLPDFESVASAAGQATPAGQAEDLWAELEDKSGWSSITGQSEVKPTPAAAEPGPEAEPISAEYSRSRTNVYGKQAEPAPRDGEARLVCIKGKDQGREFAVSQRELSIGRGPGNDIVLAEPSVSREHARLVYDGNRYVIIDQRSGNGTFVGGQRVDRARVRSGDELGFGSARFRFLEIGDVFKPVDASGAPVLPAAGGHLWQQLAQKPYFKNVVISGGIVVSTALLVVLILALRGGQSAPNRDMVFRYYLKGVQAFKKHQWSDAEQQFAVLLGLDPTYARGERYMKAIDRARKAEKQLAQARSDHKAGKLAQAYAEASDLTDTVFEGDARQLLQGINAELDARVARARMSLEAGRAAEAVKLLQPVQAIRPGRPDVLALLARAKQAASGQQTAAAPQPAPSAQPAQAQTSRPPPPARSRRAAHRAPAHHSSTRSGPVGRAASLFASGDLDGARQQLAGQTSRAAKILRAKLDKFVAVYNKALAAHRAKRAATAIRLLKQSRAFAAKITGRGSSNVAQEINRKLADMYYVQGIQAYIKNQLPQAFRSFRAAVAADPTHRPSKDKLSDLASKAQDLYESGYVAKDTDPGVARKDWHLVLQIVPPGSELYQKAKRRLDALP